MDYSDCIISCNFIDINFIFTKSVVYLHTKERYLRYVSRSDLLNQNNRNCLGIKEPVSLATCVSLSSSTTIMIELKLSCFKVIVSYLSLYLSISAYFVIMVPIRELMLILFALASFCNIPSSSFVMRILLMSVLLFADETNCLQTSNTMYYNISMCRYRKRPT